LCRFQRRPYNVLRFSTWFMVMALSLFDELANCFFSFIPQLRQRDERYMSQLSSGPSLSSWVTFKLGKGLAKLRSLANFLLLSLTILHYFIFIMKIKRSSPAGQLYSNTRRSITLYYVLAFVQSMFFTSSLQGCVACMFCS
jgi:hypothetical protein